MTMTTPSRIQCSGIAATLEKIGVAMVTEAGTTWDSFQTLFRSGARVYWKVRNYKMKTQKRKMNKQKLE